MSKKIISTLIILLSAVCLFAETIPSKLLGIWEAKDRYVFFEQNDQEEPQIVVILKTYYGWYLNRAAEPEEYAENEARVRNTANSRKAEHVKIKNIDTKETSDSLYGSLDLYYSARDKNTIPFFILDNQLYLTYYEKDSGSQTYEGAIEDSKDWTFYRGIDPSQGFKISPQYFPKNITGYIIDGDKLYDVRYWITDMDYSSDYVTFSYQNDTYQIPKHLRSCDNNFSCVSGRSKKVRNPVKAFEFKADDWIFNADKSVFTENEEPYMKQLADKNTFEALMEIIKNQNSKRKPDPPALFPDMELDWHWDMIELLEKDNKLIQEVRAKQTSFHSFAY